MKNIINILLYVSVLLMLSCNNVTEIEHERVKKQNVSEKEINDFAFYPGDGEEISVYFYKNPPKNIFGAKSESPSFCEFQGKINIYGSREYANNWNLDSDEKWNGHEIEFF